MLQLYEPIVTFIFSTLDTKLLTLKQLQQIHGQILANGNLVSPPLINTFLHSCHRSRNPYYASQFLYNLPPSFSKASSWDSMMKSSLQSNNLLNFFTCYNAMMCCRGPNANSPSAGMFASFFQYGAKFGDLQFGKLFHGVVVKLGFDSDVVLQTGLLDFYAKIGNLSCAQKVFDEMSQRDVVACNVMISVLGKLGFVEDARVGDISSARLIFDRNPVKNEISWNVLIDGYGKLGYFSNPDNLGDFVTLYNQMMCSDLSPNQSVLSLIIQFCASFCVIQLGKALHCQIFKWNFKHDVVLLTGLLDFYAKVDDLSSAKRVFDEMPDRDVVANNAMISALSKHGFVKDAQNLFNSMQEKNSVTFNSMITCYSKIGDIHSARFIFDSSPFKDVVSWNAMIDGYCKAGDLNHAEELFNQIGEVKNSVTWNTMITGFVQCKEFQRALQLFEHMQAGRVKPTEVTMVSLLSACAHLGALEMGEWVHNYIKKNKLKIDVVLGNALIDMYCKCGSISHSLDVFHKLKLKNIYCWNSIIIGLAMHGYGKEAMDYFYKMTQDGVNPDGVTFIGLLCACSHSGLISEGDSSHPQFSQINAYLVEIGKKLKDEGYEVDTGSVFHDIDDEEKEGSVSYHSERIAVAFGLMSTRFGKVIRVVKNLRTCNDCDTVMKLTSKMYKREIVMRDRNRFHHFSNGGCNFGAKRMVVMEVGRSYVTNEERCEVEVVGDGRLTVVYRVTDLFTTHDDQFNGLFWNAMF
ncbi:hypothetical protein L1987_22157 [Smallanthus sonchifolius]|uniref:Uncharacterized protein n=1 Tax=Smallanthus sonchifolius TaxID=185202 RepID=A0ACB9IDD1_9ASTR|nr:hypothetical protein L1987_22157 [Smallanthus sonchifolius]